MGNKRNFIYLFYELRTHDDHDKSEPQTKYYKCWHGARKTFKISKSMKHSVTSKSIRLFILAYIQSAYIQPFVDLVNHLMSKFPDMYQLYTSFQNRSTLPTPFEVKIALATKDLTEGEITQHLKSLKISSSSGTIQGAFDRQTAVRSHFSICLSY